MQRIRWNDSLVQDANTLCCNQRRFFGRLCQHGIACNECGCDLTGKDRQREVPRANADDRSKRLVADAQRTTGLLCIITQEIDGFAHFSNRVRHGFAGFAHDEAKQNRHITLHDIRCALKTSRTFGWRNRRPTCRCLLCSFHGFRHIFFGDLRHRTDNIVPVTGVENRAAGAFYLGSGKLRLLSSASVTSFDRSKPSEFLRAP